MGVRARAGKLVRDGAHTRRVWGRRSKDEGAPKLLLLSATVHAEREIPRNGTRAKVPARASERR